MIPIIGRLFGSKRPKAAEQDSKITITSINLKFMGNSHGLNGIKVNDAIFNLDIPFQNKMGSELLPDNLKGPNIQIGKISVNEPFKLLDINPKLPVEVPFMSKVVFNLKIQAPDVRYEGPLSLSFGNEPMDTVNISVKKIMLHYKGRSAELEDSKIVSNMQKSQVFKHNIQLYKIMSLGDTLNRIEISKPFEIVSVEPKLPIKADRKDSYIISIFIKSPQASYAGDVDINFE